MQNYKYKTYSIVDSIEIQKSILILTKRIRVVVFVAY